MPKNKLGLEGADALDVVNLKCDPHPHRLGYGKNPRVFPAYHMSKANWVSVALDGSVPDEKIFHYLKKGAIPPHLPESNAQNGVVIEAFFGEQPNDSSRGGYDVYVDGIVGPWFLEPWLGAARKGYEVHYMVLRASREITLRRAVERSKLDLKTNTELVEIMWEQFCDLGKYEANVIDTTAQTVSETVQSIKAHLKSGQNRIK